VVCLNPDCIKTIGRNIEIGYCARDVSAHMRPPHFAVLVRRDSTSSLRTVIAETRITNGAVSSHAHLCVFWTHVLLHSGKVLGDTELDVQMCQLRQRIRQHKGVRQVCILHRMLVLSLLILLRQDRAQPAWTSLVSWNEDLHPNSNTLHATAGAHRRRNCTDSCSCENCPSSSSISNSSSNSNFSPNSNSNFSSSSNSNIYTRCSG